MYRGDNTVFHLFVKRILKYLAVLLVLILMLIPVFIVSYGNIRQNILKEYTDSVNKGAGALDSQVDSVVKIAAILKEEKSYRNLLKISGELDPSQYPDLIALQKKLTTFSVSHDYIKDLYLLFRNNTVYVSNFICDDDYTRVYPRFLYEQDTGRETWRGSYFTGKEVVSLRSDVNVYSHYATPQRYQALVCTVDVYPHTFANQRSVLVCNFNFEEFVSGVVSPDILDSCVLYLKENGGQTVASYHAAGEDLSAGISSQEYEIISSSPSELGYQLVLGVPKSYLNRRAGASFFIIPVYFFIGLAAIFLLSLLFSVKETNAMGTVIRTATALFPSSDRSGDSRNEYA